MYSGGPAFSETPEIFCCTMESLLAGMGPTPEVLVAEYAGASSAKRADFPTIRCSSMLPPFLIHDLALSHGTHDQLVRLRTEQLKQLEAAGEVDTKLDGLLRDKIHWQLLLLWADTNCREFVF